MRKLSKNLIVKLILISLILCNVSFGGSFYFDNGIKKYIDDNGNYVVGWRWLDINNDNICECYRFDINGALVTNTNIRGKDVNDEGMWVVDGVVQRIYKSTGKQLYESNAALGKNDTNKYLDFGTTSNATRRINATKKDVKALMEADANRDEEDYRKSLIGPKGEFVPSDDGYVLSKGIKSIKKKAPVATKSQWVIINTIEEEDDPVYLSATQSIVAGRDMRNFVSSSNKYTAKVDGAKIYGGDVWDDCICLQGNGAYVTFKTVDPKNSKFKANYFTVEIAHQTHGESTADTYCCIELYLNGKSITSYDEFCDSEPEKIEEWLDEGETTVQLKAIVTGDAPGRKIYIRNPRFRMIKEKEED